jgi:uncharacterized protein YbaR (Trm112 family)
MDNKLFELLVCPLCNGRLTYLKPDNLLQNESLLVCKFDRLAYPIADDIPVLIQEKAVSLSLEQIEKIDE